MDKKLHLSFNADNVAVPDVIVEDGDEPLKGAVEEDADPAEEEAGETLAFPEFHFHGKDGKNRR